MSLTHRAGRKALSVRAVTVAGAARPKKRLAAALGKDWRLAYPLIAPIVVVIVGLIAYPFLSSIWYSFQDVKIGGQGRFVGLGNYASLLAGVDSARFWNSVKVTFVYTGAVLAAKFVIGMTMALILHQAIVARDLWRAIVFIPWAI